MGNLFGARYYDARTSVWQSADPAFEMYLDGEPNNGIFDPININPYRYAALNPITLMDPTGAFEESYDQNADIVGGIVQKGDSLSKIIQDRVRGNDSSGNVKNLTDRVAKANNIENPDLIMPGQVIDLSSIKNDINPASGALADPGILDPSAFIGAGLAGGVLKAFGIGIFSSSLSTTTSGAKSFFQGARFSPKVLQQMRNTKDLSHSFPQAVDAFATKFGRWSVEIGKDGKAYQWLRMQGSYGGRTGTFEWIKNSSGVINHRYFNAK